MSDQSRRKLLKSIAAGSGAIVAGKSLPDSWSKPVVDSVVLPVHAQTSGYAIGDTGPCGGIVFYTSNGGLNGLEAAQTDQGSGVVWGCTSTAIGGTGTAIGTGAANTAAILGAACATAGIAAELASNYAGGGCSGWYLPSQDELNLLYQQKNVVGGFADYFYWSSSEFNVSNAWFQFFQDGALLSGNKDATFRVRAVRGF